MKMCKVIPMLILLFTGYLCNSVDAAPFNTLSSLDSFFTSTAPEFTELKAPPNWTRPIPVLETTPHMSSVTEEQRTLAEEQRTLAEEQRTLTELRTPALLVAGISISLVFIFILIIIGVWCAWKKSKAEANSVPSGESGVYLQRVSMLENQHEWRLEGALQ